METDYFLARFSAFANEHKLFNKSDKLIVACSGGPDSVVLAYVLHSLGYSFSLAHCNFKLRGEEADRDEFFVRELAQKFKVPFHLKQFETEKLAKKMRKGIQETARILRYDWFYQLAKETNSQAVLTGHHFNDSVETFFINLLRGSGITGLAGIAHSYRIFKRPLILFKKEEILEYANKLQIRYRIDSSNQKDDYLRNRLRNHLMPLLEEVSDKGLTGVLKSIQFLSNERKILHFAIDLLREQARLKTDPNRILFDLHYLAAKDLLHASLYHLLTPYNFNSDQCQQIIQSYYSGNSGKWFYSFKHQALLNRNILEISEVKSIEDDREFFVSGLGEIHYPIQLSIKEQDLSDQYMNNSDQRLAYMNPNSLVWPLKIRHWKEGDSFVPLGMQVAKKLSDFFIDEKISISEKHNIWLIENGNGEIIWIPGYRISEKVKISGEIEKMIVFSFQS